MMPFAYSLLRFACRVLAVGLPAVTLLGHSAMSPALAAPSTAPSFGMPRANVSRVAVFDADRRAPLEAHRKPLAGFIGTLKIGRGGPVCTAFCLAPDVIATASHCLFGTSVTSGPQLNHLEFSTAADPASSSRLAGSAIGLESHNIVSGTRRLNIAPPIDAANDWALARLDQPVCRSGGLALHQAKSSGAAPEDGELYQVAMHRDLPDTELRADGPCPIVKDMPGGRADLVARDFTGLDSIIFHRCDTGPGSSGSPMLVAGARGWEVAGINIGTYVLTHSVVEARAGEPENRSTAIANTAIAAAHFAAAFDTFKARDLITTAADIASLARQLKRRGYFRRSIPRRMTPDLKRAIERFEHAAGLQKTGRPTHSLLAVLNGRASMDTTGALPAFVSRPRVLRWSASPEMKPR